MIIPGDARIRAGLEGSTKANRAMSNGEYAGENGVEEKS